jgi:plasmid stabilization system protein ParE
MIAWTKVRECDKPMVLEITPDLEEMVQSISQGWQYDSELAIIREALSLLRQRDQLRKDIQAGIEGNLPPNCSTSRDRISTRGPCNPDLRGFPVSNYIIFYRHRQEGVGIVRALHSARDHLRMVE